MNGKPDLQVMQAAFKRAAHKALHGTREERSGRLVSSAVLSVEYDEDSRELDVTFNSGKTYRYRAVPAEVYAGFLDAESKGQYVNRYIKGAFDFSEVMAKPIVQHFSARK